MAAVPSPALCHGPGCAGRLLPVGSTVNPNTPGSLVEWNREIVMRSIYHFYAYKWSTIPQARHDAEKPAARRSDPGAAVITFRHEMLFDPQLHADAGTPELQILHRRFAVLEA